MTPYPLSSRPLTGREITRVADRPPAPAPSRSRTPCVSRNGKERRSEGERQVQKESRMRKSVTEASEEGRYNTGGKNKKNRGRVRSRSCHVALRRAAPSLLLLGPGASKRASEREAYVAAARTGVWGRSNQPGRKSEPSERGDSPPHRCYFRMVRAAASGLVSRVKRARAGVLESYAPRPSVRLEHEVTANRDNRRTHQSRTTSSSPLASLSLSRSR